MYKFQKQIVSICVYVLLTNTMIVNGMQEKTGLSNYFSSTPQQMLQRGIKYADAQKIKEAVDLGADLNGTIFIHSFIKSYHNTVLNYAVMRSATQQNKKLFPIIELLIQMGADVNKEGVGGVPLVHSCDYWNNDYSLKLITLLINNGADYHSSTFERFLFSFQYDQDAKESLVNFLELYEGMCEEVENKPTQETLEKAIKNNFVQLVKKLLLRNNLLAESLLPSKELVQSIPQNEATRRLRKLIVDYLRLIGPLGIYRKQTYLFGLHSCWIADDVMGPISNSGILSMNAQDPEDEFLSIGLPKEVVLNIIKFVVE